jgi:GH25 family lysozyme M1 (1,4-beta-N-acetylmuramidase)
MTSIIRSSVGAGAAFVLVAGLATFSGLTALPASAATSSTTVQSPATAPATAPATPAPTATATAAPTSAPAPIKTAAPAPTTTKPATPTVAAGTDPSLAAQQAAGNHAMGSTIPASDPASADAQSTIKSNSLLNTKALAALAHPAGLPGLDVSAYQPSINWSSVAANGAKFAYIKATEGTTYASSTFASQYNGSYAAGLIRGAYHFATPNTSSGAAQADYFVAHGGGWSNDGHTLPPLLDIEYGYNATCWGLSQASMVSWISAFSNEVLAKTGIRPAIYSTTDWWSQCTGNSSAFPKNPLFIAHYTSASSPAPLPASWSSYSIWQWADSGTFPGDQDVFNGSAAALTLLATGGLGAPIATPTANAAATLTAGTSLTANKTIMSSNRQYKLTMDADGNLVLRGNGRALWQTHTTGNPGATAIMQSDGNFVVYSTANKALWSSKTAGSGSGGSVIVQASGDLQVVTPSGLQWHDNAVGSDTLSAGSELDTNMYLHDASGSMQAIVQTDGNFVVYQGGKAKWSAKTSAYHWSHASLQEDGNLVVYDYGGIARWNSRTYNIGSGTVLKMQADGNLVEYKGTKAVWNSHTAIN